MKHPLALAAIITGAAGGLAVGYTVHSNQPGSLAFVTWLTDPDFIGVKDALLWAVLGAAIATGLTYICKRENSN